MIVTKNIQPEEETLDYSCFLVDDGDDDDDGEEEEEDGEDGEDGEEMEEEEDEDAALLA